MGFPAIGDCAEFKFVDRSVKGHVNPKIQVPVPPRKNLSGEENEILRAFCSVRLSLRRISSFSTEIPLPVKTIASDRDVTEGRKDCSTRIP